MELNKIYNMDCIDGMKDMQDKSIDLIVTDPPYQIAYKSGYSKYGRFNTCIPNDDNKELIREYVHGCHRILKDNSAMYMFCSGKTIDIFKKYIDETGFKIKNMIIWEKDTWTAGDLKAQFGQKYEALFLLNKGRKEFNGRRIGDVWQFDKVPHSKQLHQNEKPISLIRQCVERHSREGDTVFDGFMGSGTTAIACMETNRNFMGFEISKEYYDVANERIDKFMLAYTE